MVFRWLRRNGDNPRGARKAPPVGPLDRIYRPGDTIGGEWLVLEPWKAVSVMSTPYSIGSPAITASSRLQKDKPNQLFAEASAQRPTLGSGWAITVCAFGVSELAGASLTSLARREA
jgi:hypothetical protein